jgi:hypothetical protein
MSFKAQTLDMVVPENPVAAVLAAQAGAQVVQTQALSR